MSLCLWRTATTGSFSTACMKWSMDSSETHVLRWQLSWQDHLCCVFLSSQEKGQQESIALLANSIINSKYSFPGAVFVCACKRTYFAAQLSSQETATAALLKWGYFTDNQRFLKAPVSGQMKGPTPQGRNCCLFFLVLQLCSGSPHLSTSTSLSLWLSLRTLQAHCQPLFTELILGWLSEDCFLLLLLALSDISNFYALVFYLLSSLHNYAIFASSWLITDQNADTLFSCVKRWQARIWGSFALKIFWQLLQQKFLPPYI